ncbi:MAG: hypothetical protein CMJ81_14315 [Planctomycetaceae bacterium]|nr:hypothetical protein [Planctomycetaceae bacterium]MBP63141.1 hypothetical protein [Planctomycetaceae bacterium]
MLSLFFHAKGHRSIGGLKKGRDPVESVCRVEAGAGRQPARIDSLVASLEASFSTAWNADCVLEFRESDIRKMSSFYRFLMDWKGLHPDEFSDSSQSLAGV